MADEDSIWAYFSKIENGFVKCNHCCFVQKANATGSTSNYVRHLENKHKDHHATRDRAVEKKRLAKERAVASIPKITCFTQSCTDLSSLEASSSGGIKRSRSISTPLPKIDETFGQWKDDSFKSKKVDALIVEMIALDIMPLRTPEKSGFQRLISYVAPQYKIK
ncbi:BED zinc finger domain-containing protein [Ditylenchus destructor]|uniref:BED zinc finger domain-containing protein n=1 Tax=Ditylenchus destructor TaxID=166010 RepID=A0AAD4NDK7_9BILA|nr:BED zinc finger domain-containing protein [Ditylenchus destructor]